MRESTATKNQAAATASIPIFQQWKWQDNRQARVGEAEVMKRKNGGVTSEWAWRHVRNK